VALTQEQHQATGNWTRFSSSDLQLPGNTQQLKIKENESSWKNQTLP
jgi:hypothetical protein